MLCLRMEGILESHIVGAKMITPFRLWLSARAHGARHSFPGLLTKVKRYCGKKTFLQNAFHIKLIYVLKFDKSISVLCQEYTFLHLNFCECGSLLTVGVVTVFDCGILTSKCAS